MTDGGSRSIRRRNRATARRCEVIARRHQVESGFDHVETFAALKLHIDNWRWAGVPFYVRTGKRLAERVTELAINFKRAPLLLFKDTGVEQLSTNQLVMHIQPDEGISLRFSAKIPGPWS